MLLAFQANSVLGSALVFPQAGLITNAWLSIAVLTGSEGSTGSMAMYRGSTVCTGKGGSASKKLRGLAGFKSGLSRTGVLAKSASAALLRGEKQLS